jgi:hypothetical protein
MNKNISPWLSALGGMITLGLCISYGQETQGAQPNNSTRRNPTDVILLDWQGKWDCNLDGRQARLDFNLLEDTRCLGSICQSSFKISGVMIEPSGKQAALAPRDYGYGDPPSARLDHLLPLIYKSSDGDLPMLLIMHTGNRENASGYVIWNGIPFGLQCRKNGALAASKKLTKNPVANIMKY